MSKYLITLKPLGKYFFGGDMTFQVGADEKSKFNEAFSSYIIASNKFPQQTSLLGMMRYLLLTQSPEVFSQDRNRIIDQSKATDLIGRESFKVLIGHNNTNDFGKIKSLGPCFLRKGEEAVLPVPKDYRFGISFGKNESSSVYYNARALSLPAIEGYSAKERYDVLYIGLNSGTVYKEEEIFQKDSRIGINKNYRGRSDTKGFYKQISYRLKDNFHFAFVVECDFDLKACQNEIVSLGADGSRFSLSATLLGESGIELAYPKDSLKKVTGGSRVILLSDTLLNVADLASVRFSITETIPFRFLCTNVETRNYNILGDAKRVQERYYLYERGSVFYFADETAAAAFGTLVNNKKEFRQIGYNNYIIQ